MLIAIVAACSKPPAPAAPANHHGDRGVISLVVTMAIKPEHEQEFLALARATAAKVHADEPGVLLYVLTEHPTAPSTYVWLERYRDAAALEAHMQGAAVKHALSTLPPYLAKPPEVMKLGQTLPE